MTARQRFRHHAICPPCYSLRGLAHAFALFWGIKAPAFLTRVQVASRRPSVQDGALYCVSLLALVVVACNV